jgi:hypothetical protein
MRLAHALLSLALVVAAGRPSNAQETGDVGLTMAFPAAVGVIWQTTDRLAIRPDFTFSHQESSGSALVASSNATGVGVSALFYVRKWDSLRAYLTPRFGYQHVSQNLPGASGSTAQDQYSFAGSFGAEYQLHRRFAVFAETGLIYTHSSTDNTSTTAGAPFSFSTTSNSWGTRSGVGAILYF